MKIGIATDHHGIQIKQELTNYLTDKGYDVVDYGPFTEEMVDYPEYAYKIGQAVARKDIEYGILLCNTGIGMSMACNKVKGARCAKVDTPHDAFMTRRDNDANVVAFSGHMPLNQMKKIMNTFLQSSYLSIERYDRRVQQLNDYSGEYDN